MLRTAVVIAAFVVAGLSAPALALPKNPIQNEQCGCSCETASGSSSGRYASQGINCVAFNGATCNRENANGQIETGKLTGCATILNLKDYLMVNPGGKQLQMTPPATQIPAQ